MRPSQDVIQVPRLEPKDLYDKRSRRDYARLRAYNKLLEQIYNRVYSSSQLSGLTAYILYTVPPFILGLPKLDMEDCIVYLVFQLRQAGFEVRFTWPNLLYISWKHHEKDYLMKQNPIIKAMTPEPPKPLPKPQAVVKPKKAADYQPPPMNSNPSVRFQSDVDLLTSSAAPNYSQFASPPRRAADYQPPDSFLQNMDRPVKEPIPSYKGGMGGGKTNMNMNDVLGDLWKV